MSLEPIITTREKVRRISSLIDGSVTVTRGPAPILMQNRVQISAWLVRWRVLRPKVFTYGWEEVELKEDVTLGKLADGRSGSVMAGDQSEDFAIHWTEINNPATGPQANGANDEGDAYPTGFVMQPIGGGMPPGGGESEGNCDVRVPVLLSPRYLPSGRRCYVFDLMNTDFGDCG